MIKKLKGESVEARQRFEKEGGILNWIKKSSIKGTQKHCREFLGFCEDPYSIMMGYACFDLSHFGIYKKVSSLEDYLHFTDFEFDFTSFADVLVLYAKAVVSGLEYFLHKHGIAHTDLKPGKHVSVKSALQQNKWRFCQIIRNESLNN